MAKFQALAILNGWWDADYNAAKIAAGCHLAVMELAAMSGKTVSDEQLTFDPDRFTRRWKWERSKQDEKPAENRGDGFFETIKSFAGY